MGIDDREEKINSKIKEKKGDISDDLISTLDKDKDKYINDITERFLEKYPEYKDSLLSEDNFLIEENIKNKVNKNVGKIYYILITFKKIEKIYNIILKLDTFDNNIYSYKKHESLIKNAINIIKGIKELIIYPDFFSENFTNKFNLTEIPNKNNFYNTFFKVKNIDTILSKIIFLKENKYIILDDKKISKSKNYIDVKKNFPKLFEINKLENLLFNFNINLYDYISNNLKDKELLEKIINNGLNEDIIHTIFEYVLAIRKFIFIDKDFLNNWILGKEDNILQVLDIYKNMVDTCNIKKLEYKINLFKTLKQLGLENYLFSKYLDKKVEIDKLENIISIYKTKFNKLKSKDSKSKLLNFLYTNYNFSVKHHNLIKIIPIKYLNKIQNIVDKNCDLIKFYINNKLYKLNLEEEKIDYLYKLSDNYYIKELLNLDTNILKKLDETKIAKQYIPLLLKGENIEDIKKQEEIDSFKNKIKQEIKYLDGVSIFENNIIEINNILSDLDNKNYKEFSIKISKKIKNLENTIKKIKIIEENGICDKNIKQLINIFLLKKTKKNELKISNILNMITYISEIADKNDINLIVSLLENKNIYIKRDILNDYENIFKNIINNSELILELMQTNKKNIYITELNNIINSKQNKKQIEEIVENLFHEDLKDFILEKYNQNKDVFNKLIKIAKIIQNRSDIDFYLELISKDNKSINKYYFLAKNLNILGINLSSKYLELFSLTNLKIFTEEKLQNLKKIFKSNKTIQDKDIFYQLLLEYLSNKDISIDVFEILFDKENEIISDEEFIKNTGIKGLAGWSGKDIIKKLEKLGFEKKRINGKIQGKGDHILMKNKKNTYAMIPLHKTVKAKTLFDTLNRAKISKEEFLNI